MSCQRLSSSATFVSPQPVDWAAHLMPTVIAGRHRLEQAPFAQNGCVQLVNELSTAELAWKAVAALFQ
jgi:hypothetical protein